MDELFSIPIPANNPEQISQRFSSPDFTIHSAEENL